MGRIRSAPVLAQAAGPHSRQAVRRDGKHRSGCEKALESATKGHNHSPAGSKSTSLIAGDEPFVLKENENFATVRARLTYHFDSSY